MQGGIDSGARLFANKSGTIVRSGTISHVGVNPATLYDVATPGLGHRLRESFGPDAHLLEELHLNCPGCAQKLDVQWSTANVVPALNIPRVFLNQAVHLGLEQIRTGVVTNFEDTKRILLDWVSVTRSS